VSASLIILGLRITWLDELARTSGQSYNCSLTSTSNETLTTKIDPKFCFGGPNLRSKYIIEFFFTFSSLKKFEFGKEKLIL